MKEYGQGDSWYLLIRTWFWEPSQKDDHERTTSCFENWGFWCLACDIALELGWVPTCSRSMPIESWYASLPMLPPAHTAVFASAHALSKLDLLREPLSAAAHAGGEHVRKLEPSSAFSCSNMEPAHVKNESPQTTYVGESNPTPADVRQLSGENVKNDWKNEKHTGRLICPKNPAGIAPIPSSSLPIGSVRRLGSPCRCIRDQTTGGTG